jgi:hypothetical protein
MTSGNDRLAKAINRELNLPGLADRVQAGEFTEGTARHPHPRQLLLHMLGKFGESGKKLADQIRKGEFE